MVSAHDEEQLVVEQRNELGLRMADRPADAELHLAAQDHVEDLLGVTGAHAKPDVRMRVAECLQQGGQDVRAHRRSCADEELGPTGRAKPPKEPSGASGGNFYRTQTSRLGRPFARAVIVSTLAQALRQVTVWRQQPARNPAITNAVRRTR